MEDVFERSSWGLLLARSSWGSLDAGSVLLAVVVALIAAVVVLLVCQLVGVAQGPILAALTFLLAIVLLLLA